MATQTASATVDNECGLADSPLPSAPADLAAFWSTGRIVAAQIAALGEIDEFVEHLSAPSQNNFVLRMIPKTRDEDLQFEAQSKSTEVLNKADYFLMQHCQQLVPTVGADPVTQRRLQSLVDSWQENYDEQRNLLGCANAIELAHELTPYLDLATAIAHDAPHLAQAFCDVPSELTEVLRLNLYLPWSMVIPVARSLVTGVNSLGLLAMVERFEIAQRQHIDDATKVPDFPTVILYFGLTAVDRPGAAELTAIHDLVRALVHSLHLPSGDGRAASQYGIASTPGVAVTQGFRLHKRYLQFLGVLDTVFDPAFGHALVRPRAGQDATFTSAVRTAFTGHRPLPQKSSLTTNKQRTNHG